MSSFNHFNNRQVKALPAHLKQYIVNQHYERYTPEDQAVWRYVMRQNYSYLKTVAYYPYIKGLARAGLSIERIPNLQEMNDNLGLIGWGAVTVDGFIPPSAFMEYQAYKVLVIAADIRRIEHIEYTPAPDIIHESAGHAPIIADEAYNKYLSYFGAIGAKAMFSAKDFEQYEAIRALSIIKEDKDATEHEIAAAEEHLAYINRNMGAPSEMALLSRLHWWSVEYGLIGTLENPKIYGAGLLSSIGESYSCMQPDVKKLWYNNDTVNYAYDITTSQPHLFVTPTFENLITVLDDFANTMAFRVGGFAGVQKAIECNNVATLVYSSGLQVSGRFTRQLQGINNQPAYVAAEGPCALAVDNTQLDGHGKDYHAHGFSSPVGRLLNAPRPLEDYSDDELADAGITQGETVTLSFAGDITVQGRVELIMRHNTKIILITVTNCTVTGPGGVKLFMPEWGNYDMAVGEIIESVFNGAADKDKYEEISYVSHTETKKPAVDPATRQLYDMYAQVRTIRENAESFSSLQGIWQQLVSSQPQAWLLALEILEILHYHKADDKLETEVREWLNAFMQAQPDKSKLIIDGLNVIANPVSQLITVKDEPAA